MLYRKLLLLFLCFPFFLHAQDTPYPDGVFSFEPGTTQKVFVTHSKVREKPHYQAPVLDSLLPNQTVAILEKDTTVLQIGARSATWYRIQYLKNDRFYTGYIWGGNLAIGFRKKDAQDLLFGIGKTASKYDKEAGKSFPQNMGSVKLMQDTALLEEVFFEMASGESLSTGSFEVESNHRLSNIAYTVKAGVSGEACGIPGYSQYILVTLGRKLIALPQLMGVGDADVFYHDEAFLFPNDKGGQPNTIVMNMEEMEKDEKTNKEKIKKARTVYNWDGQKLVKKGR